MSKFYLAFLLLAFATVSAWGQGSTAPPTLRIVTEDPNLPSELYYGDIKVKPLRLRPGTTTKITIDDADFFVQQHYIDMLRRFPDKGGLQFWMNEITSCSDQAKRAPGETEAACVDRKRANTSGAYFLSTEFQATGYFVYRLYKGALNRMPKYSEMLADQKTIATGIIVNEMLSASALETNKDAFAAAFAARTEFKAKYPDTMSNADFINALSQTTGIAISDADKTALAGKTRAQILRAVCDGTVNQQDGTVVYSTTYGKAFYDKEFNPAFVLMQYFGYLRRDPDEGGYAFWLEKLNRLGNFTDAEMVKAFILSPEYRNRF